MQATHQKGISGQVPQIAFYLFFSRQAGATAPQTKSALKKLAARVDGDSVVMGLSAVLMKALKKTNTWLTCISEF
jgi:hypothetical protein